jgi:hypothetical protein
MRHLAILPLVLGLLLAGCTLPGEKQVRLGEEFSLAQTESAVVTDYGNLKLTVQELSLCRTDVVYITCGPSARLSVALQGSQAKTLDLAVDVAGTGVYSAEAFGATITFKQVGDKAVFVVTTGSAGGNIDNIFGDEGGVSPPQMPE